MAYQETRQLNRPLNRRGTHWYDWLNVVLGLWLFVSPWVLDFGGAAAGGTVTAAIGMTAAWNAWVLGAIVFLLSLAAVRRRSRPEWVNMLLGVWIFIAPWVLGFSFLPAASWDHWVSGAVIVVAAFLGVTMAPNVDTAGS